MSTLINKSFYKIVDKSNPQNLFNVYNTSYKILECPNKPHLLMIKSFKRGIYEIKPRRDVEFFIQGNLAQPFVEMDERLSKDLTDYIFWTTHTKISYEEALQIFPRGEGKRIDNITKDTQLITSSLREKWVDLCAIIGNNVVYISSIIKK